MYNLGSSVCNLVSSAGYRFGSGGRHEQTQSRDGQMDSQLQWIHWNILNCKVAAVGTQGRVWHRPWNSQGAVGTAKEQLEQPRSSGNSIRLLRVTWVTECVRTEWLLTVQTVVTVNVIVMVIVYILRSFTNVKVLLQQCKNTPSEFLAWKSESTGYEIIRVKVVVWSFVVDMLYQLTRVMFKDFWTQTWNTSRQAGAAERIWWEVRSTSRGFSWRMDRQVQTVNPSQKIKRIRRNRTTTWGEWNQHTSRRAPDFTWLCVKRQKPHWRKSSYWK